MNLKESIKSARLHLLRDGYQIMTERWQDMREPPTFMEVLNLHLTCDMAETKEEASELTNAWQPWADTHFDERVSGLPYNPPPSTRFWLRGNEKHTTDDKYSHTYPERMSATDLCTGIRFKVGNVNDAVNLLKKEPLTRQCYVPIWFPEDLYAANLGERVPCTLGWHFIIREGALHCYYPMRSCDALRHFHNDLYLANRLAIWIRDRVNPNITMGKLTFHAVSFHAFDNDRYPLEMSTR